LFAGGKDWIHSITTISTPNQGTTLANGFSEIGDAVKDLLAGVFSVLNVGGSTTEMIYDAKLDQWGLSAKQSGESLGDYIKRIFKSPIFNPGFKDVCLWSLSTQGATEESTWVQTLSNIYYYSYATVDTHAGVDLLLRTIQRPNLLTMLLPLQPLGTFIGGRYAPNNGFATSWQANDGVVPLTSQSKDSKGSLVVFGGSSQIGKWNQMPQLDRMDHLAVVGITLHTQIKDMYVAHAQLLASLPAASITSSVSTLTTTESTTTAISEAATLSVIAAAAALKNAAASVNTKADLEKLCASPINTYAKNYCTNMLNNANATTRRLRG
jgi:triacylglycerol esterase/lipase EstA (alpha/beta hydrolase family)